MKEHVVLHQKTFQLFLTEKEIMKAVEKLADQINRDYNGKEVVVVGVLDGAFIVLADLLRRLNVRVSLDFVKLKSYEGDTSSGMVNEIMGLKTSLKSRHVLIVEDVIDTGKTLQYLLSLLQEHEPYSVKVATLLLKEEVFQNKFPVHYYGISVPDKFVVGYGMDYDGLGRAFKDIYAVKSESRIA